MNPSLASLIWCVQFAGLFYLDRDKRVRTSKALWLPILWIGLAGSRPVSDWLGVQSAGTNAQLEGSPVDAVFFQGVLLTAALGVLISREPDGRILLAANWPILVYFFYCLVSVAWSYHPDVSFKRWIKAIGDLVMCLVIVTDERPIAALKRLISRIGFILLPASVLCIRYYANIGHGYSPDGGQTNTGVTSNKNTLGVLVLVVSLCALWQVITLLRFRGWPDRRRHLLAQGILLAFGIVLLRMADSATSMACFILGAGLILAMDLHAMRGRPAEVHALCLVS